MPTYTADGISLIARKYRGTERLVTFFTAERGKVEAVAKGVGKPGSSLAAAVEPLTLSRLFFATGRSLDHLTQCQVQDCFLGLRADMLRFAYASYVAELTARATEPGRAHPALFASLLGSLTCMEQADDPQLVAHAYTLRLLVALGVAPEVSLCVGCGEALSGPAAYDAAAGGLVCAQCGLSAELSIEISPAARAMLRALMSLPPERLGRLRVDDASRRSVTGMLRRHIEYHLGLQLRSERFISQLAARLRGGERP